MPLAGYRVFSSEFTPGGGVLFDYTIEGRDANGLFDGQWECGVGQLDGSGRLARTTPGYSLSGSGTAHAFTSASLVVAASINQASIPRYAGVDALQTALDARAVGAASSTDESLVRFDGTTGKVIQGSAAYLNDAGDIGIGVAALAGTRARIRGNGATSGSVGARIESSGGDLNLNVRDDGKVDFRNWGLPVANGAPGQVLTAQTGGQATWQTGGIPTLVAARGFSAANYLKTPDGTCPGTSTCTIGGMIIAGEVQSSDGDTSVRTLLSGGTMFSQGFMLGYTALRPLAMFADGSYSKLSTGSYHPSWAWSGTTDGTGYQLANLKAMILALVRNGSDLSLWVNGVKWRTISMTGLIPSANGLWLGTHVGAGDHAEDAGVVGAAYAETAFTDAQVISWTRACMRACDVVDGGAGFANLWSFKGSGLAHGGSVPSTVEDLIGNVDMVRTGTLSVESDFPAYL